MVNTRKANSVFPTQTHIDTDFWTTKSTNYLSVPAVTIGTGMVVVDPVRPGAVGN